jgi:Domain of unknown function (DUF1906)
MDNAQLSRRALLAATGTVTLATFLAGRRTAVASTRTTAAAATVPLIALTAPPAGKFTRVRCVDDDTRLYLTYPTTAGQLTGAQVAAPAFYGVDFIAYPDSQHPAKCLQDLFDNTPFGFLGFYFKTTGHPGNSWTGKSAALREQGWDLVPIYVGRQQHWTHQSDNQISDKPATATTQGKADGKNAVALADTENLPTGSRLYLDIEATTDAAGHNVGPSAATIAYIKAWLTEVKASGKYKAALYDANSAYKVSGKEHREAVDIEADLGSSAPPTWVAWDPTAAPAGVAGAGTWPQDTNGDTLAIGVQAYSTTLKWEFAKFAELWQFKLDWKPTGVTFLTDTGAPRKLTDIAKGFDLDAAKAYDPGNTAPGKPKAKRRPSVTAVTTAAASVKAGKTVKVTVKLDRAAAAPNGAVVLLRSSSARLILPSSARVAAQATNVTVTATAAVGSPAGSATVRARTLYQLSSQPSQVTLQIIA